MTGMKPTAGRPLCCVAAVVSALLLSACSPSSAPVARPISAPVAAATAPQPVTPAAAAPAPVVVVPARATPRATPKATPKPAPKPVPKPAPVAATASWSYALSYTKLGNGKLVVARWNPCRTHTYKVNLAAVPSASRSAVLAETLTALRTLAAKTGMSFAYKGTTTEVPRPANIAQQSADLVVAYTTPAKTSYLSGEANGYGGFIADMTTTTTTTGTGTKSTYTTAIVKGFVVIDTPSMLRVYTPGFGAGQRRGNLLLHELGHAVGLGHVNDARLLMNPVLSSLTPNGYIAGDLVGLGKVGRNAGCITGM